jgi:HlyD family secretion protein
MKPLEGLNGGIVKVISKSKSVKIRKIWIILGIILIAAGGGFAYYYRLQQSKTSTQSGASALQTAQVRRGNLVLSATGTGTLAAGETVNLSFPTSGTVAAVNVAVGDQVKKGDALAELGDIESLQAAVNTAQLDLITANTTLETLKSGAAAALGNAQLNLATAKKAYDDAKSAYKTKGMLRCDQDTTDAYYQAYLLVKKQLDAFGPYATNTDYYLKVIKPVKENVDKAYMTYEYCAGFTDYEINSSQANLTVTQAALNDAQATLDKLQKNAGIDPDELALDQNKVDSAQVALTAAQKNLDGATLKAPFDGTILSVAGQAGDKVDTSTFISIADLSHPYVEFYVDETDMDKVSIGEEAQVVFDALPDKTFTGKVTRIQPQLVTVSNSQAIAGQVQIDLTPQLGNSTLPAGLNASVDIISGKAENALLVPIDALRDLGGGEYALFVLDASGKPRLRTVTVGLMDLTYAEIKSGVNEGEYVTTGIAETK